MLNIPTIRRATCQVIAQRFSLENERMRKMLEIKGLKADALVMRANIERLRNAYKAFNALAPSHAGDVEGLVGQVTGMGEDLEFAVNLLGNSTGESEKLAEKLKQEPVVDKAEDEATPVRSPEVGQVETSGFPDK